MNNKADSRHASDPYIDLIKPGDEPITEPPIPAATVVLLRDGENGVETLMLRKNSEIRFGGMWVFPGGRIEADDYPASGDITEAARRAAARETREEAGIHSRPEEFVWFSHWTPPPLAPKRFDTWFFAARVTDNQEIVIDGGEIHAHQWITPQDALAQHAARTIDFVPPTWVTLHDLARQLSVAELLHDLDRRPVRVYATRLGRSEAGDRIAMWQGDAGYETGDAGVPGHRHRLTMGKSGFQFENSRAREND
ncbi:MAG: NUDIX domain-containing protein [Gammaproteobacteria bacterium]|nr:NUDIX domain-containing protein [Gammaproteobacteria bacterium]